MISNCKKISTTHLKHSKFSLFFCSSPECNILECIEPGSELFINHFLAEYIQSPLTRPSGQRDDSTAILYRYQKMMTLLATIQSKINYRYSKLYNSKNSITVIKKTFAYLENITL